MSSVLCMHRNGDNQDASEGPGDRPGAPREAARPPAAWCRACREPVTLRGRADVPPEMRRAVHAGTGEESAAGPGPGEWHFACPTDEDPALRAEADQAEQDYPQFKVSVRFRVFRAAWRPGFPAPPAAPGPYRAKNAPELRQLLGAALRLSLDGAPGSAPR
jgi:hypothetical protein